MNISSKVCTEYLPLGGWGLDWGKKTQLGQASPPHRIHVFGLAPSPPVHNGDPSPVSAGDGPWRPRAQSDRRLGGRARAPLLDSAGACVPVTQGTQWLMLCGFCRSRRARWLARSGRRRHPRVAVAVGRGFLPFGLCASRLVDQKR